MDSQKEKKRFSILARISSANNAVRGISILWKTVHNLWGHTFFALLAIYLGFILNISRVEWVLIVIVIGFVIVTEAINTAFEIDIDLTSPDYHPYARDTKDVAAGAVLLSIITSVIVGLIIFLPKILLYVKI